MSKRMMHVISVQFLLVILCGTAHARTADLALSGESLRVAYKDLFTGVVDKELLLGNAMLLYTEEHDESDLLLGASAKLFIDLGLKQDRVIIGAGLGLYLGDVGDHDIFALPLALMASYSHRQLPDTTFIAEYELAPKILSGMDAERFSAATLKVDQLLDEHISVNAGYRAYRTSIEDANDVTIDNAIFIGISYTY